MRPGAVSLYEQAIDAGSHYDTMNNQAMLLQTEAVGVGWSVARAVSMYELAIDEGCDCRAMYNIAVL